jgi:hypothetical protein
MDDQGASASPGSGDAGAQWQVRVVDLVEDAVSTAHNRVIRPLVLVARAAVFGLIATTMAVVVSVLFSVAFVRVLTVYAFRGRVWASDAVVGGVLTGGGLFLWTKRRSGGDAGTS